MSKSKKIGRSNISNNRLKDKLAVLCFCLPVLGTTQDSTERKGAISKQKRIRKVIFDYICQDKKVVRSRKGRLRYSDSTRGTVEDSARVTVATSQSEESQSSLSIIKQLGRRRGARCYACKRFDSFLKWNANRNRVTNNAYKEAFFMFKPWEKLYKLVPKKQRKAKKYFILQLLRFQVQSKQKQLTQLRDEFVKEAQVRIQVQKQIIKGCGSNAQCEQLFKVYQRAIRCFNFYVEGKFKRAIDAFYGVDEDQGGRRHHNLEKALTQTKNELRNERIRLGLSFSQQEEEPTQNQVIEDYFDVLNLQKEE